MTRRRAVFICVLALTVVCQAAAEAEADAGADAGVVAVDTVTSAAPGPPEVACVPHCAERRCGDDGCGGSCGICHGAEVCDDGACVINDYPYCQPTWKCGDEGSGGTCGEGCGPDEGCNYQTHTCEPL